MADVRYKSLSLPARWVGFLLVLSIAIDVVAVASDAAELSLFNRIAAGEHITIAEALDSDQRQGLVGITQSSVFIVTAIAFLWWFARAYKNLHRLKVPALRFGAGWAIGGWFVPIIGLYRPKQIANDIYKAGNPDLPPDDVAGWRDGPVHAALHVWWGAYLLSGPATMIAAGSWRSATTAAELASADKLWIVADSLAVVSSVMALIVVRMITARQDAKARVAMERAQTSTSTQSSPA